jgi:hypothetical protein
MESKVVIVALSYIGIGFFISFIINVQLTPLAGIFLSANIIGALGGTIRLQAEYRKIQEKL